jgi:hypothetical protein
VSDKHTLPVSVLVNGEKVGRITEFKNGTAELTLPSRIVTRERLLTVTFVINNPVSPAELTNSGDTRQLGLGVTWIEIAPRDDQMAGDQTKNLYDK